MFMTLASLQSFTLFTQIYIHNSACLNYNRVEPADFYPQQEVNLYSDNCHYYLEDKVIGRSGL